MDELIKVSAHCDNNILHAPGECQYCDKYPEAQEQRIALGYNFTTINPDPNLKPCPAMEARSYENLSGWAGNHPENPNMDSEMKEYLDTMERPSSKIFYGGGTMTILDDEYVPEHDENRKFNFKRRDRYINKICNFFLKFASKDYRNSIGGLMDYGFQTVVREAIADMGPKEIEELQRRLDNLDAQT